MKILMSSLTDQERLVWVQSFRDRLPGILKLVERYEKKLKKGKNGDAVLRQIFHSTRHTIKGAINLTKSDTVDPEIRSKLNVILRYLQCLEDRMLNNKNEPCEPEANDEYQPFFVRMFNMLNNDDMII